MSDNPLLAKLRIPGETFRMPSQGLLYSEDVLSPEVKDGEVHIYPMSAWDEIIIRSPDKLYSGDAIVEVFARCIPQILEPRKLFVKDVDFLMVCLRKVTYGDEYKVNFLHNCKKAKRHEYPISMGSFIKHVKQIDPTSFNTLASVALPNGQIIVMKPLTYEKFIEITQDTREIETPEELIERTKNTFINVIDSVDGIQDKQLILEWLSSIPATWAKQMSTSIDTISDWGVEFIVKTACQDCGEEITLPVPVNPISFFI